MKKKVRKPLYTFDEYKIKYPYGGTSTNVVGENPVNTIQPIYPNNVNNNYTQTTPASPTPTINASTLPQTQQSGTSYGQVTQGMDYATAALGVYNTANPSKNPSVENQKLDNTMDSTLGQIPVMGPFYRLGNQADAATTKRWRDDTSGGDLTNPFSKRGAGVIGGSFVNPGATWKENAGLYENGNIDKKRAGWTTAIGFVAPQWAAMRVAKDRKEAEESAKAKEGTNFISGDSTMQAAYGGYLKRKFQNGGNETSQMPTQGFMQDAVTDFKDNRFMTHPMGGVTITQNQDGSQDEVDKNEYKHTSKDGSSFIYSDKIGFTKDGVPFMLKEGQKLKKGDKTMAMMAREVGKKITNKKYS